MITTAIQHIRSSNHFVTKTILLVFIIVNDEKEKDNLIKIIKPPAVHNHKKMHNHKKKKK